MTKLQAANRLVKLWRKRLNLLDWTIFVHIESKLTETDYWAQVHWSSDEQRATIDLRPELPGTQLEVTIVHELLHVRFQGHEPYPGDNVNTERALNSTAAALVAAYRGGKNTK